MGIETNRIETEFIIKSVCEKNIPVSLHHGKNIIQCSFEEYDLDKTIKVKIGTDEKDSLKPEEKIKIYFFLLQSCNDFYFRNNKKQQ